MITAVDGHQIDQFSDLYDVIAAHKPGDTLTLTVIHDGQTAASASRSPIARPASTTYQRHRPDSPAPQP